MILCDREILQAIAEGRLVINPVPSPADMSSTSVDLKLAARLDRWEFPANYRALNLCFRPAHEEFIYKDFESQYTKPIDLNQGGFNLEPHAFVLGWTAESIYLPHRSRLCARVEGKSSLARLGLGIHVTAPTVHAGFGFNERAPEQTGTPLRLEIWNVGPLPIELQKGMRICQLILEEVREVPTAGYQGQFNRQGPSAP